MRIQDPVFKDCFLEMTVDRGFFHMNATVRLKALMEMYLLGFIIVLIVIQIKKQWKKRHA